MTIATRLADVEAQIAGACRQCGRDPATVQLLAVSKTRTATEVREAIAAGQRAFGENRVQELVPKARELDDQQLAWHMIGSVQANKARDLLDTKQLTLLHSLDRSKLADVLQRHLDALQRDLDVLIQTNATADATKHGVVPAAAETLVEHVLDHCPRLRIVGVMAMGPLHGEPAPVFARVAVLHAALQRRFGLHLPILSLGMTADLDAAIAAGSTLVRVGTGVFGPRTGAADDSGPA